MNKKYNKYDITSHDYGIGWTYDGYEFYFDLLDYDLIKNYCWLQAPSALATLDAKELISC